MSPQHSDLTSRLTTSLFTSHCTTSFTSHISFHHIIDIPHFIFFISFTSHTMPHASPFITFHHIIRISHHTPLTFHIASHHIIHIPDHIPPHQLHFYMFFPHQPFLVFLGPHHRHCTSHIAYITHIPHFKSCQSLTSHTTFRHITQVRHPTRRTSRILHDISPNHSHHTSQLNHIIHA